MTWRHTQLGNDLCDQDKLILGLFNGQEVRYVGSDKMFESHLNLNDSAKNLILIINRPIWCSEIIKLLKTHLNQSTINFYLGINRYLVLGNDTQLDLSNTIGVIPFLIDLINKQGFTVTKTGSFDNDRGRYYNFVQPLTWLYGTKTTNTDQRE